MSDHLQSWLECWENNRIDWHVQKVHPALNRNAERLLGEEKTGKRVFVPLCGKSYDMKWLVDLGNKVIGVEASDIAVRQLFEENQIPCSVQKMQSVENGKLFLSNDEKYHIFCCDIFALDPEKEKALLKPVDAIWDRGSLEAVDREFRPKYGELIRSISNAQTTLLLETADREPGDDTPYCFTADEVIDVYGKECTVQFLENIAIEDLPGIIPSALLKGFVMYLVAFK